MRRLLLLGALLAAPLLAGEIPVSAPSIRQGNGFDAAVASDGTDFLVVWHDNGGLERIRCARVLRNGVVADPGASPRRW